jgi:hypothetical protein
MACELREFDWNSGGGKVTVFKAKDERNSQGFDRLARSDWRLQGWINPWIVPGSSNDLLRF